MKLKNQLFEFDKEMAEKWEQGTENGSFSSQITVHSSQKPSSLFTSHSSPTLIIGTDEAGRGPGAGGVFASAVYFHSLNNELIEKLSCLNDSKKLSKKKREELFEIISQTTIHSTVCIEVAEIERINILNASLKAMKLACEKVIALCPPLEGTLPNEEILNVSLHERSKSIDFEGGLEQNNNILVLVDGNKLIKQFDHPQQFIIKGDGKSASIAAASILAKVTRDRYMEELHEKFPQYNWMKNAGYLTKEHLQAIDKHGMTPIHRKTFLRKHFERIEQLKSGENNAIQIN